MNNGRLPGLQQQQQQTAQPGSLAYTFRAYNMAISFLDSPGKVPVVENCFAFMFTNLGNTNAFVNGMIVFPSATPAASLGDSRTIGGHLMDLYKGDITVSFGAGTTPRLELIQLFYITPYKYDR